MEQEKTKMEAMLRSILDEILESKLTAILSSILVASIHSYNTRLASNSTYYLNTIKTNYGKFNFRFMAVKVWNNLDENIKHLPLKSFKNKVMSNILQSYCSRVFFFFSFFIFFPFIYLLIPCFF